MTLPSSPPKERVVIQNPPANEQAEKNQLSYAFGKVKESKKAAEQKNKTVEQNAKAAEQVTEQIAKATEQVTEQTAEQTDEATEQNNEQTDEVDVSPPPSVSVDQMMKNSTPTNSQSESRHTPSLSPINEHVSCHMLTVTCLHRLHDICSICYRVNNKLFSHHHHH